MNLLTASIILLLALTYIAWSKPKEFRFFSSSQKNQIWAMTDGYCNICGIKLVPFKGRNNSFEADHIKCFFKGGKTILSNAQPLCRSCNRKKGCNDNYKKARHKAVKK